MRTIQSNSPFNHETIIRTIRGELTKVPDHRDSNKSISMADALMSLYAVFAFKFPSLLKFEKWRKLKKGWSNLKSLFYIKKIPSDTQMRTIIDKVDVIHILPLFKKLFQIAQRGGKLKPFEFIRRRGKSFYLLLIDGTQYFSSNTVHCKNCLVKNHRNGETTWHHQLLAAVLAHPLLKQVLPITVEGILKQDGIKKNDCELIAVKRLLARIKSEHPKMGFVMCGDALYANGPLIKLLKQYDMSYILNVKPAGNKILFKIVNEWDRRKKVTYLTYTDVIGGKVRKTRTRKFRFINKVPLNDASSMDFSVNFSECWETIEWTNTKGVKKVEKKHFSWVTDIPVTKSNVLKVMQGGRCRWKVENETFNTLKNGGYEFEHNYGHGKKNLSMNSAVLMFLAFMTDQILQMGNHLVKKAIKVYERISTLIDYMRSLYRLEHIKNWDHFWNRLINNDLPEKLPDTS